MKKAVLFICLVLLGAACFAQYSDEEVRKMVFEIILTADTDFSVYYDLRRANDNYNKNHGTNEPCEFGQHRKGFTRMEDEAAYIYYYINAEKTMHIIMGETVGDGTNPVCLYYSVEFSFSRSSQALDFKRRVLATISSFAGRTPDATDSLGAEWYLFPSKFIDNKIAIRVSFWDSERRVYISLQTPRHG